MKFLAGFACVALLGIFGALATPEVRVLSDADFEHLTQAATGATTGDWFVKFYAPWCGHCKAMAEAWKELAVRLDGKVNVAEVDATVNRQLAERFAVRGYPTIMFFHHGKMASYKGARSVEAMEEFATEGFRSAELQAVPKPPTAITKILKHVKTVRNDLMRMFAHMKAASAVVAISGFALGALVAALFNGAGAGATTAAKPRSPSSKRRPGPKKDN